MKGISPQMSDNIKKVILCKYGEVALKGANRRTFESAMLKDIARRVRRYGDFDIYTAQSTVYIEPKEGVDVDFEGMKNAISRVFGISAYCEAAVCEKDIDAIRWTAGIYLPPLLRSASTFRAEAKRADKAFPIKSPELAAEIGRVVF
jgi:thiamine biosynthesis protein ThiI